MSRRTKLFLITAAGVIVIVVIAFVNQLTQPTTSPFTPGAPPATPTLPQATAADISPIAPASLPAALGAQQLATVFAERYGTYSSAGDFVNVEDLLPFMTDAFRADRAAFIRAQRNAPRGDVFSATTTIVLRADVASESSTRAIATIATQRTETRTNVPSRTYPHTLTLALVREGETWKVDGAVWK